MRSVVNVKRQATPGDMLRTLAVILVPILVIVAFFTRGPADHPVTVVDFRPVLHQARAESPYPVLAPEGLPDTWRATSASWVALGQPGLDGSPSERNAWKLGMLNPEDVYVGLAQGDRRPDQFIEDLTRSGSVDGESRVGDQVWTRRLSLDGRTHALVRSSPEVTTIVVSDSGYALLEAFASTLRTD